MAVIKMDVPAADGALAIRVSWRGGKFGALMLIIEAGEDRIEISAGNTNADADNLTGQLAGAAGQAGAVAGTDDGESAVRGDPWVRAARLQGRML